MNIINQEKPTWNIVGFIDDNTTLKGKRISQYGFCLGGIDVINNWDKPLSVAIPIGSPNAVDDIAKRIINPKVDFPNIIHPDFKIADLTFKWARGISYKTVALSAAM